MIDFLFNLIHSFYSNQTEHFVLVIFYHVLPLFLFFLFNSIHFYSFFLRPCWHANLQILEKYTPTKATMSCFHYSGKTNTFGTTILESMLPFQVSFKKKQNIKMFFCLCLSRFVGVVVVITLCCFLLFWTPNNDWHLL